MHAASSLPNIVRADSLSSMLASIAGIEKLGLAPSALDVHERKSATTTTINANAIFNVSTISDADDDFKLSVWFASAGFYTSRKFARTTSSLSNRIGVG